MPSNILPIKAFHGSAAEEQSRQDLFPPALCLPLKEESLIGCPRCLKPCNPAQIFGTDCWTQALKIVENSCRKLSSEQQARFAVALFNCHMRTSGKRTTTCTEDMSIKVFSGDDIGSDGNGG